MGLSWPLALRERKAHPYTGSEAAVFSVNKLFFLEYKQYDLSRGLKGAFISVYPLDWSVTAFVANQPK